MKYLLYKASITILLFSMGACSKNVEPEFMQAELFSLTQNHAHGASIVELPNGDLLAAWFQGSGERWADDVQKNGPPQWEWQQVLFVKPGDKTERGMHPSDKFVNSVECQVDAYGQYLMNSAGENEQLLMQWEWWKTELMSKARGEDMMRKGHYIKEDGERVDGNFGYPYFRRMGWQTKNKAVFIDGGRMILPLYSDGFSFSLMALTDDGGKHWQFSEPLVAPGNIQASIALKKDGTLVSYMRDNGPPPKRLMISESRDRGASWSMVRDSELPNEGSGADVVTLKNGNWVLAYNDTEDGRHSLAVSISQDEGLTWPHTRHLELDERDPSIATQSSYPSIIEGKEGTIHVIYSYHRRDRDGSPNETIKYARIDEQWIMEGD